jgi:hypothetical protein
MNNGSQETAPSGDGYDVRSLTKQFEAKRAEIKFFRRAVVSTPRVHAA